MSLLDTNSVAQCTYRLQAETHEDWLRAMLFGVLVENFGIFVRERYDLPPDCAPVESYSQALSHLHNAFGHHIIPLSLLSRSDGSCADCERKVIVEHCLFLARASGQAAGDDERAALEEYVVEFRPTLVQLEPALHRLEHEPAEHLDAFLAAAKAVIEADGVVRPEEARFLEKLAGECAAARNSVRG